MQYELHEGRAQNILPALADSVHLIITSPPYGTLRAYGGHNEDFDLDSILSGCYNALVPSGILVWVVGDQTQNHSELLIPQRHSIAIADSGFAIHQTLIYMRAGSMPRSTTRYAQSHEHMIVAVKGDGPPRCATPLKDRRNMSTSREFRSPSPMGRQGDLRSDSRRTYALQEWGVRESVWVYNTGRYHSCRKGGEVVNVHEHPATFPYALAADHIRSWSLPGDTVLDPMAGSGTVLRAAIDLGRNAIGIEVNPDYCDLIQRRMSQPILL